MTAFPVPPVGSLHEMHERLDRVHVEAQDLIAESQWLRLKSRELRDRIRRERLARIPLSPNPLGQITKSALEQRNISF